MPDRYSIGSVSSKAVMRAGGLAATVCVAGLFGHLFLSPVSLVVTITLAVFVLLVVILEVGSRLLAMTEKVSQKQHHDYDQLEALASLLIVLKPEQPLPRMRGWAASPDLMHIIVTRVMKMKPEVIVECGAGVSTLLIAYALKRLGHGHVYTIDHDESFSAKISESIAAHKLNDWATVVYAPLKVQTLASGEYNWYDPEVIHQVLAGKRIDMLVVDGPPGFLQKNARYPALSLLVEHTHQGTVVIMDDTNREDETNIATLWAAEFSLSIEKLRTEKGTLILTNDVSRLTGCKF